MQHARAFASTPSATDRLAKADAMLASIKSDVASLGRKPLVGDTPGIVLDWQQAHGKRHARAVRQAAGHAGTRRIPRLVGMAALAAIALALVVDFSGLGRSFDAAAFANFHDDNRFEPTVTPVRAEPSKTRNAGRPEASVGPPLIKPDVAPAHTVAAMPVQAATVARSAPPVTARSSGEQPTEAAALDGGTASNSGVSSSAGSAAGAAARALAPAKASPRKSTNRAVAVARQARSRQWTAGFFDR